MTRKDYVLLAKVLRESKTGEFIDAFPVSGEEMRLDIIGRIATMLQQDNPRFNREKFITACEG
jgi:hypothetical protein